MGSNHHIVTIVGAPVVVPNPVRTDSRNNLLVALPSEALAQLNAAVVAALVAALAILPTEALAELTAAGVAALVAALAFLPSEALAELNAAGVDCFNAAVAVLTAASLMVAFEAEAHQLTLDTLFDWL